MNLPRERGNTTILIKIAVSGIVRLPGAVTVRHTYRQRVLYYLVERTKVLVNG
jgi:hypothetical protein